MRLIFTLLLSIFATTLFAQPLNDDCLNATQVNIGDCAIYNNVGAGQDIANVNFTPIGLTCPEPDREVWFYFITPQFPQDIQITITGMVDGTTPAMSQPMATFISGDCTIFEASFCAEANVGGNSLEIIVPANTLAPNFPYYILVSDFAASGTNEGAFELCVEEYTPPQVIDNITVSNCTGTIYDTGGPTGDYSPNENFAFTITPNTFNQCILATVNFYNTENGGDNLTFYDGPNTSSPVITDLSGVGSTVLVQAASGSLTIGWTSDATIEESGFEISWECSTDPCEILNPVDVNSNVSVSDLIQAFSTPQVIVENPILNCPSGAYGTYSSPNISQLDVMGMPNGIVLSSGLVEELENDEAFFASTILGAPGDPDLDAISPITSNDACVLEFDVYAATDELLFRYVFGSEEYPGFVGTNFNDIFAFFISGPGLTPNTNIAVLADGTTPVSINTVNDDPAVGVSIDPVSGEVIYNDNDGGQSITFGGYTSVMTARADVIPCNYYHLKLAIADRGDSSFDSGVFLADLQAGLPDLQLVFDINSANGDNILVEECSNNDYIIATLTNPDPTPITYYIQLEGDIDEDLDLVTPIPDSLVAPPGTTTVQIPFVPTSDGLAEGVEHFGLQIFAVYQCDTVVYDSVSVSIYDEIDIHTSQDTFYVCPGTSTVLDVGGGTAYTWTWPISGELDNPNLTNPTLTPSQSGWIYVDGIINANSSCIGTDSAYIELINPVISIPQNSHFICEGSSVQLEALTNTGGQGVTWFPITGLSCTDCPNPIASPIITTVYTATVTAGGCSESATLTVNVDPLASANIISNQTICEGESIVLAGPPTSGGSTYLWSPNNGTLDDETSATPIATPSVNTTYTVVSTSANGACQSTQSVDITVFPATIDIMDPDTLYQCNTSLSQVTLNATSIVPPTDIVWTDSDGNSLGTGSSIDVNPSENTTYIATVSVGGCTNADSLLIQIDSLPDFDLNVVVQTQGIFEVNPDTVDICSDPNEFFYVQNIYQATNYPDMMHEWLVNGNSMNPEQTGANLLANLPLSTNTYYLVSNNNACMSVDSFVMDVNAPQNFMITPSSTTICEGESVTLQATGANSFTWIPDDGSLSDVNSSSPIATPTQTTTYTAFTTINGCQVGVSSTINVVNIPNDVFVVPNQTICEGESIFLGDANYNQNYIYDITPLTGVMNGGFTGNPEVAPTETTLYTITALNGSCSYSYDVLVTVSPELFIDVTGNTNVCLGETTTLNANTQGAVTWYDDMGNVVGVGPTLSVTGMTEGIMNYEVHAISNYCSVIEQLSINVGSEATLSLDQGDTAICLGDPVTVTATSNGTVLWQPLNEFSDPTLNTQILSPNGTTTYHVVANNNGCTTEETITIEIKEGPDYGVHPDETICIGEAATLGFIEAVGTTYSWTATPSDPTLTEPTSGVPTVFPEVSTTYCLTANKDGCEVTECIDITVLDISVDAGLDQTICQGETAELIAQGSLAWGEYTWYDQWGGMVGDYLYTQVSPWGTTEYHVSYMVGNCTVYDTMIVNVIPSPQTATLTSDAVDNTIIAGETTILTANGYPSGSTYTWYGDQGVNPTGNESAEVNPEVNTTYTVEVTTPDGCVYYQYITIFVKYIPFQVPNIFTPNGDGLNDYFHPVYDTYSSEVLEFKVFDRWGELVWDSIDQPGWDGTYKGKPLPSEVYVYMTRVRYRDGTEELKKGDVALMR